MKKFKTLQISTKLVTVVDYEKLFNKLNINGKP